MHAPCPSEKRSKDSDAAVTVNIGASVRPARAHHCSQRTICIFHLYISLIFIDCIALISICFIIYQSQVAMGKRNFYARAGGSGEGAHGGAGIYRDWPKVMAATGGRPKQRQGFSKLSDAIPAAVLYRAGRLIWASWEQVTWKKRRLVHPCMRPTIQLQIIREQTSLEIASRLSDLVHGHWRLPVLYVRI